MRVFIIESSGRERELGEHALEYIRKERCPLCGGKLEILCNEEEIGYVSYACRNCHSLIYSITESTSTL